jgi:hypothetical protein
MREITPYHLEQQIGQQVIHACQQGLIMEPISSDALNSLDLHITTQRIDLLNKQHVFLCMYKISFI